MQPRDSLCYPVMVPARMAGIARLALGYLLVATLGEGYLSEHYQGFHEDRDNLFPQGKPPKHQVPVRMEEACIALSSRLQMSLNQPLLMRSRPGMLCPDNRRDTRSGFRYSPRV